MSWEYGTGGILLWQGCAAAVSWFVWHRDDLQLHAGLKRWDDCSYGRHAYSSALPVPANFNAILPPTLVAEDISFHKLT